MAAKKEAKTSSGKTAGTKGRGIKASSEGRKIGAPDTSLSLTFVHGCVCVPVGVCGFVNSLFSVTVVTTVGAISTTRVQGRLSIM